MENDEENADCGRPREVWGEKEKNINFLKSYTVTELLHNCLSPLKRI